MKSKRTTFVAAALAVALVGGGFAIGRETRKSVALADARANDSVAASRSQNGALPSFADLAARVSPAVVNIKVTSVAKTDFPDQLFGEDFPFPGFRGQTPQQPRQFKRQGTGSGFIIRKDGLILTNNHVVENAQEITVTLTDKQQYKAKILGRDPKTDLAVIKIEPKTSLPTETLGDSDAMRVGDWVMAIGNPFGLTNTVTTGIVSAKGRTIGAGPYDDFIQTDAPINPGNSGGPLFNMAGEVVGINAAIISRSGGSQGIGFAIPSNTVRTALESLLKQGRIIRGYLGILARSNQSDQTNGNNEGLVVDDVVPGSPAAAAQLQKGDIIRKFDGHDVKSLLQLRTLISQVELNKKVELEVIRDGKSMKVAAQIKEQPIDYQTSRVVPRQSPSQQPPDENEPNETNEALASVHVTDLTPEMARQLDLPNGVRGVVVTNVDPDSGVAELQKGDVIEEVNQQPVTSVSEYNKVVASLDPNQAQVLSVCRHRVRSFLVLRTR